MTGRIEQYTNVVVNTGVKNYRDVSINEGTKALFDVSSAWAGGAKNISAGAQIKSLSYEDSIASFTKAHDYSGGGMVFAGVKGDTFDLPAEAAPKPEDKHWLATMWLKIANYGVGTAGSPNNQIFSFSTSNINDLTASMFVMALSAVDGASPSAVSLYVRGRQYSLASQLEPLFDGLLHQFVVECEISDDNTKQRIIIWLDKVKVYESIWNSVAATVPGAPTYRYIGTSSAFPVAWTGSFYRYRRDDLTATPLTAEQIIAADSASIGSRFS